MVNQEILGALKSAIVRGHSIEQAMQTILNSGYPQNEIQEAAKFLETGEQPQQIQQPVKQQEPQPIQTLQTQIQQPTQSEKTPQKVSSYEATYGRVMKRQNKQNTEKGSKILAITLIIILALLLGALIAFFIFKDQIISIFTG